MRRVAIQPCRYRTRTTLFLILAMGQFAGCASAPDNGGSPEVVAYDPWEPANRKLFAFNRAIDKAAVRPLATGYRKITPTFARHGISNFFANLTAPRSSLNNFLQGKPARGFSELGRFLVNTTIGLGGLFDIASGSGIERFEEDFSQTLAVWGLPPGPYLVLPALGPHTVLDSVSLPVDFYSDLQVHFDNTGARDKLYGLRLIDLRSRLLAADMLLDSSQDPYITLRESFLQNREFEIFDGDPPVDEEFYEVFDDE